MRSTRRNCKNIDTDDFNSSFLYKEILHYSCLCLCLFCLSIFRPGATSKADISKYSLVVCLSQVFQYINLTCVRLFQVVVFYDQKISRIVVFIIRQFSLLNTSRQQKSRHVDDAIIGSSKNRTELPSRNVVPVPWRALMAAFREGFQLSVYNLL